MPAPATGALDRASATVERWVSLVLRGRTDPDAPWRSVRLLIVWLLTRMLVVGLIEVAPFVVNDVNYYATVITGQAGPDFPGSLREYPVPALWLLTIPGVLSRGDITAYGWWFFFVMLVVDGAFLFALDRLGGNPRAVTAWLAAGVAIGPLLLLRFDLVTGAAVGVALVVAAARPRAAAVLMALATGIKLWPAVLIGVVGAPARPRRPYVMAIAIASAVLVLASLAGYGWDRLLTPLEYQTGRGLQIESLAAYPSMVLWALGVDGFVVDYPAASLSFEVSGPGTAVAAIVATAGTAVVLLWVLWSTARLWRLRGGAHLLLAAAWVTLSSACLLVLTNKVFSPQYLAWLVPVAVSVLALDRGVRARTAAYLALAAAVSAHVLFPWLYPALTGPVPVDGSVAAVALIGIRLVLVCALAWVATRQAWTLLRAAERETAAA